MNKYKSLLSIIFLITTFWVYGQDEVILHPKEYDGSLKNPLKGFTTVNVQDHPWASITHTYIRWNEIENNESDKIEKIISVCNQKWKNAAAKNMKVIPRVYLHWDGDKKYWPDDMQKDDYTSAQFQTRVLRLIKRLGACWDNDPRVAFVEMGIIGKWGEHHSPSTTAAMQKLIGDAFAKAFKNKKVSVRHMWSDFTQHPFGEYWDSWAHYDQMWGHGNSIKKVNDNTGRYKDTYIGGEVAYGWGNTAIQPGETPTLSVSLQKHRDFVINSIRWLHCTQVRWITAYDQSNSDAVKGAEEIQKAFGYRYIIDEVRFSVSDSLKIAFDVTNTGSAPFYYNWPVEVALLDSLTLQPVWKAKIDSVDLRNWLPGDKWTDPQWKYVGGWQEYLPNENWNPSKANEWETPPEKNKIEGKFKIELPDGNYILSLAILDPAGDLPSIKFATENYLKGGRHPMGMVNIGENKCDTLPGDFRFDEPNTDKSLYYDDKFEIVYDREPEQKPYGAKASVFPGDTVSAWQYDYLHYLAGDKYFSLDSAKTIGIYGCNDTTGINIRLYKDSVQNNNAAQFKWNKTSETFEKNGQWLEFTSDFIYDLPYQLLLRAGNNVDARFKLSILTAKGDTAFFKDFNLKNDFINRGGGNEQTDWFISNIALGGLWGTYTVKFDWYDNIGEPGVFGGFSFVVSEMDVIPPKWYYISLGTFSPGTNIVVMTTEDATVYFVPQGTSPDTTSIKEAAVSATEAIAYRQAYISTAGLMPGDYVLFAIDASGNISEASSVIKLQYPVNATLISKESEFTVTYNPADELINITSTNQLSQINVYNILGKRVGSKKIDGITCDFQANELFPGVYLVQVIDKTGNSKTLKVLISRN